MDIIKPIVDQLKTIEHVQAIVLGGSHASHKADTSSDIDLYVYVKDSIDIKMRESILNPYCSHMEIANKYWEEEDDVILLDGTVLEIIYRDLKSFVHGINRVAYEHLPMNAYTTCMWYSLLHSHVIYEQNFCYSSIQKRYQLKYPERLTKRIIEHHLPLLTGTIPSFDQQILKALKRKDYISVNHRITEFLATYFDLLFALNKMLHPGEKRMVEHLLKANYLPHEFETLVQRLVLHQEDAIETEVTLLKIITHLQDLLKSLNY